MPTSSDSNKSIRDAIAEGAPVTPTIHVIIMDGTMSSLCPGLETNAGIAFKLISEMGSPVSVHYERGLQSPSFRKATLRRLLGVLMGVGINHQIRRAYSYLASRYRPGDKIYLLGFSRGAYAVRSLAGIIDLIGLLRAEHATERNIRTAYRYYECGPKGEAAKTFANLHCHDEIEIEMIGVWDTVKSLGINAPVLWRFSIAKNAFHSHELGASVKHGYQALAYNENRVAYSPIMWESDPDWPGHVEQMWFRGAHGDIGGHLGEYKETRPLSNIPLVWILEKAESCGLPLPSGWRARYPQDVAVPATGTWRGLGRCFIMRKKRKTCVGPSEQMHPSLCEQEDAQQHCPSTSKERSEDTTP